MTDLGVARPIPHVALSQALLAAAQAVNDAKAAAQGAAAVTLKLCHNPMNVGHVRDALETISQWFVDPEFFFSDDPNGFSDYPNGGLKAVDTLILLATLLREHLRLGNTP